MIAENKVTIIVATYRREKELKRALDSLINQTYSNVEIIVVDDNDDSEWNKIVRRIVDDVKESCTFIDLQYIENHPNQGSARSRNIGIEASKGRYITFLDDDDLYEEKNRESTKRYVNFKS